VSRARTPLRTETERLRVILLRRLAAVDGFQLVPVELDGPAGADGLRAWLASHDRRLGWLPVRAAPTVATLLERAGPDGLLLVGPEAPSPAVRRALGVLNRHRDRLGRVLARPLLWTGPRAWLATTAEEAPDLWSIRTLRHVMPSPGAPPAEGTPEWATALADLSPAALEGLRDRAQAAGDRVEAARTGYLLAGALAGRARLAEALTAVRRADAETDPDDPELAFDLAVLGARLTAALGDGDAPRWLARARVLAGASTGRRAQVDLVAAGQEPPEVALGTLRGVLDACREDRPTLAARAALSLGRALRGQGSLEEAQLALREGIRAAQQVGELLAEANLLVELAAVVRAGGDRARARTLLDGALPSYRRHGATDGLARALLQRGICAAELGDAALAQGDLAAAARIYARHRLPGAEARARLALAEVLDGLGDRRRARRQRARLAALRPVGAAGAPTSG